MIRDKFDHWTDVAFAAVKPHAHVLKIIVWAVAFIAFVWLLFFVGHRTQSIRHILQTEESNRRIAEYNERLARQQAEAAAYELWMRGQEDAVDKEVITIHETETKEVIKRDKESADFYSMPIPKQLRDADQRAREKSRRR